MTGSILPPVETCPRRCGATAPLVWEFESYWSPPGNPESEPGRATLSWTPEGFHLCAQLHDCNVRTDATADDQSLWELGDVLEIFLGANGAGPYLECHIAPNGFALALLWPSVAEVAADRAQSSPRWPDRRLRPPPFNRQTRQTSMGWDAEIHIPATSIQQHLGADWTPESVWEISLGRYDYGPPGNPPVLSSTSRLTLPDFHRRSEWRRVRLAETFS